MTRSDAFLVAYIDQLSTEQRFCCCSHRNLLWIESHRNYATALLACMQASQITSFGEDLRNGLVLGALLAAHWPSGNTGALLTRLHQSAEEGRHLKENQDIVVKAMQVGFVLQCMPATSGLQMLHY